MFVGQVGHGAKQRRPIIARGQTGSVFPAGGARALFVHLDVFVAVARAAGAEPGVDEAVEVAVEDALGVAGADAGAQVLHHLVRLEDVAANLGAETDFAFFTVKFIHLGALFVLAALVDAGLEDVHGGGLVLDLGALVLADDDDAGGRVGEADGGVGGVDALAAFAGGAVNVDADIGFVELDVDVFGDFGDDVDGAERRVAALVGIEGADADEAVDAALGFGVAVGVFAFDEDGGFADAGGVAGLHVHELDGVVASLGPARIHAEHDVCPVVGLGAAGASLDGEDGVVAVELAGEEGGDLEFVELGGERGKGAGEFLVVGFLRGGVFARHELDHDGDVIDLFLIGDDG